ncbi:MAG: KamA family radical SAM protein [Deltaproteobacteria bacterium]|nr:KamA family radical SAM protein [Deltaproteobacteria bacterium]
MLQTGHPRDWHDMLSASITTAGEIAKHLPVDPSHIRNVISRYPMRINPYYLSLIKSSKSKEGGLFKQVVPDIQEISNDNLVSDPLYEEIQSPVPNLIHRYPNRILFMVSNHCPVYCRFCMRKRKVGNPFAVTQKTINDGIAYIKQNRSIHEVIVSGGDPLLLEDEELNSIMDQLRSVKHIEIIRIHTRVPCALPQRITPALAKMLSRHHPVFMNIHFNHPDEITTESSTACAILADAGIPLGSQTVLLKGINNDPAIIKKLMLGLLKIRVKPYYLHHPDPVRGTRHFRTPIKEGLDILKKLRGHTSGLCVPSYMIDLPEGGGKVPLLPEYKKDFLENSLTIENYQGKVFDYPED